MHPTPAFRWDDQVAMLSFAAGRSFATLVDPSLRVAQAPLFVDADHSVYLHLSRANPMAQAMPVRVVAVVSGDDAYISPDWYESADQVPTWNYESVEIEGELTPTDDAMLVRILEGLSAKHEAWIIGKKPWTLDKLSPGVLAAKLEGIIGAKLAYTSLRGTQKLLQNKSLADRDAVVKQLAKSPSQMERGLAVRTVLAKRPG
ncbi:MAG: FMN-binding negative transcriptional regulator [Kofleriaceae bacterium]